MDKLLNLMHSCRSEASLDDLPPGVDPLSNAKHLLPLMLLGITDEESNIRCSCLRQVEAVGSLFCRKLDSSPSIDNGVRAKRTPVAILLLKCNLQATSLTVS